jgi:abortive infection bacteriophage resistance protein
MVIFLSVKVLSFGIISELYSILKEEDQDQLSSYYGISSYELNIYLSLLSNYRNVCAHEDILYDHQTQRSIPDNKYHRLLNIPKEYDEYIYGKTDFFAIIIMMKFLLDEDKFTTLVNEISYETDVLAGRIHSVDVKKILNKIGFPDNWREISNL